MDLLFDLIKIIYLGMKSLIFKMNVPKIVVLASIVIYCLIRQLPGFLMLVGSLFFICILGFINLNDTPKKKNSKTVKKENNIEVYKNQNIEIKNPASQSEKKIIRTNTQEAIETELENNKIERKVVTTNKIEEIEIILFDTGVKQLKERGL